MLVPVTYHLLYLTTYREILPASLRLPLYCPTLIASIGLSDARASHRALDWSRASDSIQQFPEHLLH
nr:hypothetical protein Q903MT_gene2035 [Picea sitchensis]